MYECSCGDMKTINKYNTPSVAFGGYIDSPNFAENLSPCSPRQEQSHFRTGQRGLNFAPPSLSTDTNHLEDSKLPLFLPQFISILFAREKMNENMIYTLYIHVSIVEYYVLMCIILNVLLCSMIVLISDQVTKFELHKYQQCMF